MTKKDKATLVEALKRICADVALLASLFEDEAPPDWAGGDGGSRPYSDGPDCSVLAGPSDAQLRDYPLPACPTASSKLYTYEETRAILAEKSRSGFRSEVKSILTAHGISQLSDVKDPNTFAAIVAEAEAIRID